MRTDREAQRLKESLSAGVPWKKWGPYLSERQWGTVREDYSRMGMRGTTSATTRPARGHTAGARMAWPVSAMIGNYYALASRCGMAATHP